MSITAEPRGFAPARPMMPGLAPWLRRLPALAVTLLLALLVLPPIATVLRTSLADNETGAWTLANFAALFADRGFHAASWNSVRFAFLAMLLSLTNGAVLAWLVERTDTHFRTLAVATAVVSLGTPHIVYVSAWQFLLGRAGPFNTTYRWLFDSTESLTSINTMTGMVVIEGLLWTPLVFLLLSATFRQANADMEEAARICGASVRDTLWRVTLRLAAPAVLGVGLFVFIRNLEAFDVPVLIGMPARIEVLTTNIYLDMTHAPPELGRASAFSVLLMAVVAVLLMLYGRISRHADRYASVTGKGFRPRPFRLGTGGRALGGAIILANFCVVLVLPLAALLWTSLTPFTRPMSVAGLSRLTTRHYDAVFSHEAYLGLVANTAIIAALAATLAMALMLVSAWMSVRRRPASGLIEQMTAVPLVFPGVVLGVAMLEMTLNLLPGLYGTLWLVAIAFVVRYMPYGMRYCHAGVMQVHRELEEAAGVAGSSQPAMLRRILLPLAAPAVVAGWLFIFLLAAKELSVAVLLAGPGSQTIAVALFDQWTNGAAGEVAAMGVVWTTAMTAFTLTLFLLTRRRGGPLSAGGH